MFSNRGAFELVRFKLEVVFQRRLPPPQTPYQTTSSQTRHPVERFQTVTTDGLKRDQNVRISFFDPSNQIILDRLLSGSTTGQADAEGDDENSQATMANVEEMLEGYEWASDDVIGRKTGGSAGDLIEARLLDELLALEKVRVPAF